MIENSQIRFGSSLAHSQKRAQRVQRPRASYARPSQPIALTGRLMECASFVSCGFSNKDIAKRLKLSEGTIKIYISECFGRLRIRGRLALALWYRNNFGLVDGSDALVGVYE